jgi:hypothetical protein
MKFGIIKERKSIPDRRVVFSPDELARLKQLHQHLIVKVESSDSRVFTDAQYKNMGIEVADDISDCEVFFGVKEVPVEFLIPNKSYFFFSHTIKKQPYNRNKIRTVQIAKSRNPFGKRRAHSASKTNHFASHKNGQYGYWKGRKWGQRNTRRYQNKGGFGRKLFNQKLHSSSLHSD